MKYILHIDMNSFFASVEELQNPKYANKPLAVGGRTRRSVVASANYIARKEGVKAAMPLYMAKNLCPKLIIAEPHFDLYQQYSEKFLNLIEEKITTKVESFSIDECYVDITSLVKERKDAIAIANYIQKLIWEQIHLKCSIGIANNKFLAKMGSDLKKPMGISTLWQEEIKDKLWPQPIENMLWIGKSTAKILIQNNIKTIKDIAQDENKPILEKLLDKNWYVHYLHANGHGEEELNYSHEQPKSIGASETFLHDTNDSIEIVNKIKDLIKEVVHRLHRHQLLAKTISINIKTPDFKTYSKSHTSSLYTDDLVKIYNDAVELFQKYFSNKTIRLIGVSLSNLENIETNYDLFEEEKKIEKINEEADLVNKINKKFSKKIIYIAKDKLI